jgi:hypothetical protein
MVGATPLEPHSIAQSRLHFNPARLTTISAGNYEWPFKLVVPGSMVESIEGLDAAHVKYKLKATVARRRLFHDLHA